MFFFSPRRYDHCLNAKHDLPRLVSISLSQVPFRKQRVPLATPCHVGVPKIRGWLGSFRSCYPFVGLKPKGTGTIHFGGGGEGWGLAFHDGFPEFRRTLKLSPKWLILIGGALIISWGPSPEEGHTRRPFPLACQASGAGNATTLPQAARICKALKWVQWAMLAPDSHKPFGS